MAADDVKRIAEILATRVSTRMRLDGGDPRLAETDQVPRFKGFAYPVDDLATNCGYLAPGDVTAINTNNSRITFVLMLTLPRQNLRNQIVNRIYPLVTPGNPFGVLQSLQRKSYEDLHLEVGGLAFPNPDADALTLGATPNTNSGQRWFSVNVLDIEAGSDETKPGGTKIVYMAATMEAQIPLD